MDAKEAIEWYKEKIAVNEAFHLHGPQNDAAKLALAALMQQAGTTKVPKGGDGEELFKLMQENPELPVLPMVDSEVVCDDDYNRWTGSWGSASIDEYLAHDGRVFFRSDDDKDDVLGYVLDGEEYIKMTDEEVEAAYNALPWVKAIIVNIDTP